MKLVEKVGNPWLAIHPARLCEFTAHRDAGMQSIAGFGEMCPHAYSICHVKAMELNDAGEPVEVDTLGFFGLLKQGGFKWLLLGGVWHSPGDHVCGYARAD